MRNLLALLLSIILSALGNTSCKAVIYDLTTGGTPDTNAYPYRDFTVNGPFPDGYLYVTLDVVLVKQPDLPPVTYMPPYSGWSLVVFGNYGLIYFACGSNVGADCGYRYIPGDVLGNPPHPFPIFASDGSANLSVGIEASTYSGLGPGGQLLYDVSVDLPDGYSIDGLQPGLFLPNAPEPSTWAMLLIGFAAIGFAGYRRSKSQHVAPDNAKAVL